MAWNAGKDGLALLEVAFDPRPIVNGEARKEAVHEHAEHIDLAEQDDSLTGQRHAPCSGIGVEKRARRFAGI